MQKYKIDFVYFDKAPVIMRTDEAEFGHGSAAFKQAQVRGNLIDQADMRPMKVTHIRVHQKMKGKWLPLGQRELRTMRFKIIYCTKTNVVIEREVIELPDVASAHEWANDFASEKNQLGAYYYDHFMIHEFSHAERGFEHFVYKSTHSVKPWYETKDIGLDDVRKQADDALNEIKLPEKRS